MTNKNKITLTLITLASVLAIGVGEYFLLYISRDYREAEPLYQHVSHLSIDLKEFKEKNGRIPENIREVIEAYPNKEYQKLQKYNPVFSQEDILFQMNVNKKYGFKIDKNYLPSWVDKYEHRTIGSPNGVPLGRP